MAGVFSGVSGKSYGIAGESLGLVSGGWKTGECTGPGAGGVSWRSLASAGGVWVWVERALMGGSGSQWEVAGVPSRGQRAGEWSPGSRCSVRADESEGKGSGSGLGTLTTSSMGS